MSPATLRWDDGRTHDESRDRVFIVTHRTTLLPRGSAARANRAGALADAADKEIRLLATLEDGGRPCRAILIGERRRDDVIGIRHGHSIARVTTARLASETKGRDGEPRPRPILTIVHSHTAS